jgi:Ca-activated chloride channel family protein
MTFIWPAMLFTLFTVPLFGGLYWWQQQRRQRITADFGRLGLVQEAAGRALSWQRHLPPLLFLLSLILLLLALARPEAVVSLPRIEGTVILAFDVSGSMAAEDLEPSRMEAAKVAARQFVERQPPSVLVGIVAFSDSGFTVQAPTNDQEAIFTTINRLAPELGTSLASGIFASLNALIAESEPSSRLYSDLTPEPTPEPTPVPEGEYGPAVIVLLSDGENNERPDPLEAAQLAADRGVRIYTVGIGSTEGIDLELEGFTVHTRLNEAMLQRMAQITGGTYYNAGNEAELQAIYENLQPEFVIKPEKMEVTSIFAGFSMLLLLAGGLFSLLWFGRLP